MVLTRRTARWSLLLAAALAGAHLPGCASDAYRFRYEPMPAASESAGARLLATVLGARDGTAGALDMMHVRFRIESPAGATARLLPESLQLLSGDLREFGPAQVLEGGALEAADGAEAVADVAFPFPDFEDYDLRGLRLSWTLAVDGESFPGSASFERMSTTSYRYYDPYPYPYHHPWHSHWQVGVGFSSH